jgi:hypothetical protein
MGSSVLWLHLLPPERFDFIRWAWQIHPNDAFGQQMLRNLEVCILLSVFLDLLVCKFIWVNIITARAVFEQQLFKKPQDIVTLVIFVSLHSWSLSWIMISLKHHLKIWVFTRNTLMTTIIPFYQSHFSLN